MPRAKRGRLLDLLVISGTLLVFAVVYAANQCLLGPGFWRVYQLEFRELERQKLEKEIRRLDAENSLLLSRNKGAPSSAVFCSPEKAILDLKRQIAENAKLPLQEIELSVPASSGKRRKEFCLSCHLGINREDFASAEKLVFRRHPKAEFYFKNHPPERFGCTVCHEGNGDRLDLNHEQVLRGKLAEANCVSCHENAALLEGAETALRGARLFQIRACYACHQIRETPYFADKELSYFGPDLRNVKAKLAPSWLVAWIENPRKLSPRTMMPVFGDKGKGLPESEALQLTAFLLQQSETAGLSENAEKCMSRHRAGAESREKGQRLLAERGCLACHDLGKTRAVGAKHIALDSIGNKVSREWLYSWIEDPSKMSGTTIMPRLKLSPAEICAIVDFLESQKANSLPLPQLDTKNLELAGTIEAGKKLVGKYGCYNCHAINGFAHNLQKVGPDLSEYGQRDSLTFSWGKLKSRLPKEKRNWYNYTQAKLTEPKAFETKRLKKVMPVFSLSPKEEEDLLVFLRGLKGKSNGTCFKRASSAAEAALIKGEQIFSSYNCLACHSAFESVFYTGAAGKLKIRGGRLAPNLSIEGRRVQSKWLSEFLKEPQKLRPYTNAIMPTFGLKDEDLKGLSACFDAQQTVEPHRKSQFDASLVSRARGEALFRQLKCRSCHNIGLNQPTYESNPSWYLNMRESRRLAPDLTCARKRLRSAWTIDWLMNPQAVLPDSTMPFLSLSIDDAESLRLYVEELGPASHEKFPDVPLHER